MSLLYVVTPIANPQDRAAVPKHCEQDYPHCVRYWQNVMDGAGSAPIGYAMYEFDNNVFTN
jgi:hypothetical protein